MKDKLGLKKTWIPAWYADKQLSNVPCPGLVLRYFFYFVDNKNLGIYIVQFSWRDDHYNIIIIITLLCITTIHRTRMILNHK